MLSRVINRCVYGVFLLVFGLFLSCNDVTPKKENYLYHQNIKELIKANEKDKKEYKVFLKANNKNDTVIIKSAQIEKKLAVLFKHGLRNQDLEEYKEKNYNKNGYKVIEITALKEDQEIRKLLFKENSDGEFYYLIETRTLNRLASYSNEMSFASNGNFLIISHHQVPFSYDRTTRTEGKLIDRTND